MSNYKSFSGKVKKLINKWQDLIWSKVIVPFADLFKIDCEYCWWWRGFAMGSVVTSILFIILSKVIQ